MSHKEAYSKPPSGLACSTLTMMVARNLNPREPLPDNLTIWDMPITIRDEIPFGIVSVVYDWNDVVLNQPYKDGEPPRVVKFTGFSGEPEPTMVVGSNDTPIVLKLSEVSDKPTGHITPTFSKALKKPKD